MVHSIAKDIVKSQGTLNSLINPSWRQANYDWRTAIMMEAAEAFDSTPWKWWKQTELDEDNLVVELVDILHFLVSTSMVEIGNEETKSLIVHTYSVELPVHSISNNLPKFQEQLKQLISLSIYGELNDLWRLWTSLWYSLGKDYNDMAREYLVKNYLNIFRQKNGYNTGEYQKIWIDPDTGNKVEDNVLAYKIAANIPMDSKFSKKFNIELQKLYEGVKNA